MKALVFLFIPLFSFHLNAQVNAYAQVTSISSTTISIGTSNETNATFVTGLPVIIMQMQDNTIGSNVTNSSTFGTLTSIQSTGQYEITHISAVTRSPGLTQVTISSPLANTYNINANSSVQLISYPLLSSSNYTTSADIAAVPWTGSVGGVVAFRVGGILTLNHNITADNAGFRGGAINAGNAGSCDNGTYISAANDNYGNKGESIYKVTNNSFVAGRGKILNGGGGGNSHNGGGGGGANASGGGEGGKGYTCSSNAGGLGGATLYSFISSARVFMGGGGGSGEGNNNFTTTGGNGGGMIIINASEIKTSGSGASLRISANGQTATDVGNDGAGGGGAGGSILLSVNTWNIGTTKTLTISANGGGGGNVTDPAAHGGGGGGGQGSIIFSTATPTSNITTRTLNGTGGRNSSGGTFAENGTGADNTGIFNSSFALLPVSMIAFDAKRSVNSNLLSWQMENDEGISYYEVQRSFDGSTFETIGKVYPASQEYSFTDINAEDKNIHYRIIIHNYAGRMQFSRMLILRSKNSSAMIVMVVPNPVLAGASLKIETEHGGSGSIRITNSVGITVAVKNINLNKGGNTIPLGIVSGLMNGTYHVIVNAGNNSTTVKMLLNR
ncbi:MAG TPA: T9SS type A sorting domain-containing protein [Flavitalea sp.]|nr:T9SS type A sorting domain-containing protein [Flavitalea sp.]